MAKENSRTKVVGMKTIYAAFNALKSAGGSMNITNLLEVIRKDVQFDDWEKGRYEKTGYVRWESIFHFYSIDCTKAGLIQKNKGIWVLTPEGEAAMKLGPEGLLKTAVQGYQGWKQTQKPDDEVVDLVDEKGSVIETIEQSQKALLGQFEEKAYAGLRDFVLSKNPYDFQKMVAVLLSSMGYYISHVAPKGKDGGIDVIAYNDPLGTKPPRIMVQVKHRPESKVPSDDIQKLIGAMPRNSDVGIFVTSGEFSGPAVVQARQSGKHIELIDFDRFIDLWKQHYHKMDDEQKYLLPLHPIYFLGNTD